MDVEEAIRSTPLDGVVLLVGCDKTTPSLLMGAASVDLPAIVVTGGPMLNGWFQGERVGSGTHLWKFSEAVKAGEMTQEEFLEAEGAMSRSPGTCNTMGTASTMASMAEALGMALSGNAAIPGRRQPPPGDGASVGPADRADGQGRPEAVGHPDQAGL